VNRTMNPTAPVPGESGPEGLGHVAHLHCISCQEIVFRAKQSSQGNSANCGDRKSVGFIKTRRGRHFRHDSTTLERARRS
jgi:hypothetical protein